MDATLQDPMIGQVLDGRYRVEARIAAGGMATVYRAVDTRLERVLALKVMHPSLVHDGSFVERFIREAKAVARLDHPNVVNVFDQGMDGSCVYLAMEYVAGCTLRDVLARRGALQPRAALDILEPILAALGAAHRAGLVHRDMKPENVLIGDDGRVKVADFGLVRAVDAQTALSTTSVMGTVSYLAPEHIEHGLADPGADVYACGVMLYEMLTGTKPHTGDTPAQVLYLHLRQDVPPPSAVVPGLAGALDELVARGTARDRAARPADAAAMLAELRAVTARLADAELDLLPPAARTCGTEPGEDSATTVLPRVGRTGAAPEHTSVLPPVPLLPRLEEPEPTSGHGGPRRRSPFLLAALVLLLIAGVGAGVWYINSGQFTQTPSVLRMPSAEAKRTLADAGLRVRVEEVHSASVDRGLVVGSDPAPGTRVRDDGTVTISVSLGPEVVAVPELRDVRLTEARRALEDAGLEPTTVTREFSTSVERGAVIRTKPPAGTERRPGTAIELVVSKGERIPVPEVTGADRGDARDALEKAGFTVTFAEEQEHSDHEAGSVAAQSPEAGAVGAHGDTVTLTISKGPEMVTVPDVTGRGEGDAVAALEEAGFEVTVRKILFTGEVFSQSVDGGDKAPKGSTITLWVR
ncbi:MULTISPECIES: Stk1 family PASTA domain-containing Ser/Thr kinase [unclassified Streptomyces]|uniref:Stk1 family PASTA domain-containing Ser/Thr kinase n=1 Tax=unclassified Streptomyces TaxID=2593676 RepID=UPI0022B62CB0|nr:MULTISPECIES: Stk1 family PASTA domain-containing Ser/Thr kinase [unclassified Streptomyces]MCZ7413801.1 Stk1 family PASTA domain-containing Ser/Thr kinase [Streptomyces sp. WMMC897]MCZ7430797.1 Stk1 family PASTA domain-containing Ser/Thr kinase [Streptomyces sp. WMMC1477]